MSKPMTALHANRITKAGRYAAGDGVYLQVTRKGTKSWLFLYMLRGKSHAMGLGSISIVSLSQARDEGRSYRKLMREGIDPLTHRREQRALKMAQAARSITFNACAEKFIASNEIAWKNQKHKQQWRNTIATYCDPVIGNLPVASVDAEMILKIIEPIWTTKHETASRVRGRIEAILDWASAPGRRFRSGDNPARLKGLGLPPARRFHVVRHHAALAYAELPAFLVELRRMNGMSPKALEFVILTATRTSEVTGARWSEINMKEEVWTIPSSRMKSAREHRVPLSLSALQILKECQQPLGGEGFVFCAPPSARPLSNMAFLETLRRMKRPSITVHGFRSSFRDWAAERSNVSREVAEMALAHSVTNKVEAAYRRGDLFEKRRRLMRDWAVFCSSPPSGSVIPLRSHG